MSTHTPTAQNYSIREAAKLSGLPESTLRYYETISLLRPIGRDPSSKHRRYTDGDIDYAVAVACLNATGMSIGDMRAYLSNRGKGAHSAQDQIALLESHKQHLAKEAYSLQLRQRYIDAKIAYWHAVSAGDTVRAKVIGERARSVSRELRSVGDEMGDEMAVSGVAT